MLRGRQQVPQLRPSAELEWAGEVRDEAESESSLDKMRRVKRPIAALIIAPILLMFGMLLIQIALSLFGQLQQLFNR